MIAMQAGIMYMYLCNSFYLVMMYNIADNTDGDAMWYYPYIKGLLKDGVKEKSSVWPHTGGS